MNRPVIILYRQFATCRGYPIDPTGKLFARRQRLSEGKKKNQLRLAEKRATEIQKIPTEELFYRANAGLRKLAKTQGFPSFHNVQRDRFNLFIHPTDNFRVTITTSKNNVHIQLMTVRRRPGEESDLWNVKRTIFRSYAGSIGIRGKERKTNKTAFEIGRSFGSKCRRLGIKYVDVVFRYGLKVSLVLKGISKSVTIKSLLYIPRLPKCKPPRTRKRRRV